MATDQVAAVHSRFARAAVGLYLASAVVAVTILATSIAADRSHQERQIEKNLLLETQLRAHYLDRQLDLLSGELRRLGLRSEINLRDHDLEPERSLLRLSHEKSAFFNVGVALVDADGTVLWSEPRDFLAPNRSFASAPWFSSVRSGSATLIVPVDPDRSEDAILYLVSPISRNVGFAGALLGVIDLARGWSLEPEPGLEGGVSTVLATRDGVVVYPSRPPGYSAEAGWKSLFVRRSWEPFLTTARLAGADTVVTATPVPDTELVLLSLAGRDVLLGAARSRMRTRLALGVSVALVPLLLLVLLLVRSFRVFRAAEARALREERLQLLGEASNLIAHEVKNSLNGLRMGIEILLRAERPGRGASAEKVVGELRKQIQQLSDFTSELLIFSKGILPRPAPLELVEFAGKMAELARARAADLGVSVTVSGPGREIRVRADPSLIHVVLSNLLGNALDAASGNGAGDLHEVAVSVGATAGWAWVRVSDSGPGVSERVKRSLFEPFVSGKPSGVGIGLALSRRIARAHGGDLALEASASGARFLLTLPREGE